MRLTIFGSGYVGLVTGACLAEVGNNVLCVDVDERKVEMLKRGESPIYEPGLDELLRKNLAARPPEFHDRRRRGRQARPVSVHRGRHAAR